MAKTAPPTTGTTDLDATGYIGHIVPGVLGLLALFAAFEAQTHNIQITLVVSLIVTGLILVALAYLSMVQRSRGAWSFLISMSIVLGVMTLFGAPKIRTLLGIHMSIALVIPVAFGIAAGMLGGLGQRYKN